MQNIGIGLVTPWIGLYNPSVTDGDWQWTSASDFSDAFDYFVQGSENYREWLISMPLPVSSGTPLTNVYLHAVASGFANAGVLCSFHPISCSAFFHFSGF